MNNESFDIPEPAKDLWHRSIDRLEQWFPNKDNGLSLVLGGDTLLAARWQHRRSTDLDFKVPHLFSFPASLIKEVGQWTRDEMSGTFSAGSTIMQSFIGDSNLDLLSGPLEPYPEFTVGTVEGRPCGLADNLQILHTKLSYRSFNPPARDLFDLVVAEVMDPMAASLAVNAMTYEKMWKSLMQWNLQEERLQSPKTAKLSGISPRWEYVPPSLVNEAAETVQRLVWRTVEVHFSEKGAYLVGTRFSTKVRLTPVYDRPEGLIVACARYGVEGEGRIKHARLIASLARKLDLCLAGSSVDPVVAKQVELDGDGARAKLDREANEINRRIARLERTYPNGMPFVKGIGERIHIGWREGATPDAPFHSASTHADLQAVVDTLLAAQWFRPDEKPMKLQELTLERERARARQNA